MARNALQYGGSDSDNPLSAAPWTIPDPSDPTAPISQGAAVTQTASAVDQWMEAQRQKSAQMGLWNDQTGLPTMAGVNAAVSDYGNALLMGTTAPGGKGPGFTAYHGSPHSFDQFDLSKIGTGEGAQAYGHGMYLADAEGVARGYKMAGQPSYLNPTVAKIAQDAHGSAVDSGVADPIAAARNSLWEQRQATTDPILKRQIDDAYNNIEQLTKPGGVGHMYEVQVNADPAHFLDWDKPLSEQHPVVRDALTQIGIAPKMMQVSEGQLRPFEDRIAAALQGTPLESAGRTIAVDASHASGNWDLSAIRDMLDPASRVKWDAALGDLNAATSPNRPEAWAHLTGQDAHRMVTEMQQPGIGEGYQQALGKSTARDVAASQALHEAGIPGIRYLDAGSRGAGEGSRNSVVFNPANMEIIRKYGLAGLMAGGGAAATQGQQQQ